MSDVIKDLETVSPTLLLSMPQLEDPNFKRSVVLLCQHSAEGAWGLVLNRPTGQRAAEVVQMDPPLIGDSGLDIWMGGPVEPNRGCILLGEDPKDPDALELTPGLFLSGSSWLLRRLLERRPPARTRLMMGYAGWGPGQLEAELTQSAWLIGDLELDLVFETDASVMWETAIRRLGADPATLQMSTGVH
ncbi:MAG: YqgE/AlgH family protein [Acidobacteria bacterium]|nr:YqgE/AlgH family protein [Acidobacteriota bacterium]